MKGQLRKLKDARYVSSVTDGSNILVTTFNSDQLNTSVVRQSPSKYFLSNNPSEESSFDLASFIIADHDAQKNHPTSLAVLNHPKLE